jgi:hypothetical protein
MMLLKRPLGVWILMAWCAVQALGGLVIGLDSPGMRAVLAWTFAIVQALFVAGLALPMGATRHLVVVYLTVKFFALAVAVWAIIFVAVAWGLRNTDLPLVVPIVAYQVLVTWAFLYLFHPDVQAYLRGYVNAPVVAR